MQQITALAFDLFDTLVTVESQSRHEAPVRLLNSLRTQGLPIDSDTFFPVYREVAQQFMEDARREGKETHNRFWISTTLQRLGHDIAPDDSRIAVAVEAYFSAFLDHAVPVPDTLEMLSALKGRYRLGLLSNLTHAPAARQILARLGMAPFFDVVLISGDLGYRKPHAHVFRHLIDAFAVPKEHIAFIGDDLDADIRGAQQAGLQPIWTVYARMRKALEAPGTMLPADLQPPPTVPTIASWHELLLLLDGASAPPDQGLVPTTQ